MKAQLNPAVVAIILAVVVAAAAIWMYMKTSGSTVDTSDSLSPEMRAKITGHYGGGTKAPTAGPQGQPQPPGPR